MSPAVLVELAVSLCVRERERERARPCWGVCVCVCVCGCVHVRATDTLACPPRYLVGFRGKQILSLLKPMFFE